MRLYTATYSPALLSHPTFSLMLRPLSAAHSAGLCLYSAMARSSAPCSEPSSCYVRFDVVRR